MEVGIGRHGGKSGTMSEEKVFVCFFVLCVCMRKKWESKRREKVRCGGLPRFWFGKDLNKERVLCCQLAHEEEGR